jgi:hypothetical protein
LGGTGGLVRMKWVNWEMGCLMNADLPEQRRRLCKWSQSRG